MEIKRADHFWYIKDDTGKIHGCFRTWAAASRRFTRLTGIVLEEED